MMLVVAIHTQLITADWVGLGIFFALSGFLITGILLDAKERGSAGEVLRAFYVRRALRILPLSFAVLAVAFVVGPRLGLLPYTPRHEQLWYWLYVSNWMTGPRSSVSWQLSHFWTLAVEEQFYIVWPFVVLACSRKRLGWVAIALLILSPLVRWRLSLLPHQVDGHPYEEFTVARLDELALGSLAAVYQWRTETRIPRRALVGALSVGLAASALAWNVLPPVLAATFRFTGPAIAATALVLLAADGWLAPVFCWRPLAFVGTLSYGIYILHRAPMPALQRLGLRPGIELFVATATLAVSMATISWYAFEQPILSLKRYWPMPRGRTASASGAATASPGVWGGGCQSLSISRAARLNPRDERGSGRGSADRAGGRH